MSHPIPETTLQLQSLITRDGELRLSLAGVPTPRPAAGEVLVRIEAAPLNPSDIGVMFGPADIATLEATGTAGAPSVRARLPAPAAAASRFDLAVPVGNEGAGIVVAAGESAAAQALIGKAVAVIGGGMYAQYRAVPVEQCLLLPDGATPADGASCYVNPLTALGMVETMRLEGHTALVHTAAASNLGQMLNRICLKDGIGLVNVVRSEAQAALLRDEGARHVCNSAAPDFIERLTDALAATGATLAFDATGGGRLAGQILGCMEQALLRQAGSYQHYGSPVHKQVYLYGRLDTAPVEFTRNFGMAWGMGGWLLFPFLEKIGEARVAALKRRVADELKTTFASRYTRTISLAEALDPQVIAAYYARATGEKYLIDPSA